MKEMFIKNDKQKIWLEKLEGVRKVIESNAQNNDEHAVFPFAAIDALREIGYMKTTLPEQYGGEGCTIYDAILLQETLSSFEGSTGLITCWTLSNIGEIFEHKMWPTEALQLLAQEVNNGAMVNKAVSEFVMGSPTRGGRPETTAIRAGEQWVISGRKNYMTGSFALDYFITLAWMEQEQTTGFFLIPKTAAGVSIEETWDVSSMRSTGSHDLVLDQVRVPKSALVEVPSYNTGFKTNSWLLLIPATYLGIAQAARDYAVQFAKTHSPNSIEGTIAELPNVQQLIGEIELELMKSRYAIYSAAEICEQQHRNKQSILAVNATKHIVTNSAITIVDKAMRVVGAKSLQRGNPLQRYYRDVRAGLHNPPMDDVTVQTLAKVALFK